MNLVLTILSILSTALAVLKQIPETAALANEIAVLEKAFTDVLAAAEAAKAKADQGVDPTQLNTIEPLP